MSKKKVAKKIALLENLKQAFVELKLHANGGLKTLTTEELLAEL